MQHCLLNESIVLVVCAKSNVDPSTLLLSLSRRSSKSVLVNLIGSLMERNDRVSNTASQRFRLLLGMVRRPIFGLTIGQVERILSLYFQEFSLLL